jgi:hypothetical protein
MSDVRERPVWFWSHDIGWDQVNSVLWPGMRMVSVSGYGAVTRRRFASVMHQVPAGADTTVVHLDPAALAARLSQTGERPIAIAATPGEAGPVLTVAMESGPAPAVRVEVGLDEAGVRALLAEQRIDDIAWYQDGDACRYAVLVGERAGPSWLVAAAGPRELAAQLRRLGASVVRLRMVIDHGQRRLVALARPAGREFCAWYVGIDADGVAGRLERHRAYPVDLDAVRDERGVRYAVVMYRPAGSRRRWWPLGSRDSPVSGAEATGPEP